MAIPVWTNAMTVEQALELPKGHYAKTVASMSDNYVEQSVEPDRVAESADAIIEHFKDKKDEPPFKAYSQAQIIVKAQELELKWQDWGKLMLC